MNVLSTQSLRRVMAIARCDWLGFHRQGAWAGGASAVAAAGSLAALGVRGDAEGGLALLELTMLLTSVGGALLALVLGSQVVAREWRDRTWMIVLARPVSRGEFLAGKFVGVALVLGEVALAATILVLALMLCGAPWVPLAPWLCLALWAKWCLAAALAVLFACLTSGTLALLYASTLYVLGHAGGLVRTFAESEVHLSLFNHWGGLLFYHLLPHFEVFEHRLGSLGAGWDWARFGATLGYAAALGTAWLALAHLAWEGRELS
ncbi:MAG: ABC transporter permease subunit [Candidatus Sericytochromatia bacterium]|nr:ABC transporter permease subunit [Candidatus Sericytochromatia bacterium]